MPAERLPKALNDWFRLYGWKPFPFQREAWRAYLDGKSGLVHAPTGTGKTLAVWLGPIIEWLREHPAPKAGREPLRVLWVTPLRALATDTVESLRVPVEGLGIPWTVEKRTGDTSSSIKARQKERMPTALVTTPESLSLLLSYPDARKRLSTLRCVIVDEWHELLGTKRGIQTELCLARLRGWIQELRTWGLSATLGNLEEARDVLLGNSDGKLIQGKLAKDIRIDTLIPREIERFPWSGHLGLKILPQVIDALEQAESALLFTNTRSQAEQWFASITEARRDWLEQMALHHGSLDRALRGQVEDRLRDGSLRCVVCTSSLDLGVDFAPVDLVIQVGSPKGIARLLQRAGRSGHRPGAVSRVLCVPTNAFELIEFSAARDQVLARNVERRGPLRKPLDVLVQHLVTAALGGGFREEEMLAEVRGTHAYRDLGIDEWNWALDFAGRGGPALKAYPQYARIVEKDGVYKPQNESTGRFHRLNIGTITSDQAVAVKAGNGAILGSVEEAFVSRLKPGDRFLFAGKVLELERFKDMTARVRAASAKTSAVPRWMGGRMPLSTLLAEGVQRRFAEAREHHYPDEEMRAVAALLDIQREFSILPDPATILVEQVRNREGWHCFVYTFAGRLVHEGLSALVAWRIARIAPRSIITTVNDYGFELLCKKKMNFTDEEWRALLSPDNLLEDLLECLNGTEMARRQFREVARVAGLVIQGFPGTCKTARQLQASSGLLYDVFQRFDPQNLLIEQARREVLENQLEINRLRQTLVNAQRARLAVVDLRRLTPLAFPLFADRLRENVSNEDFTQRLYDMIAELEGPRAEV